MALEDTPGPITDSLKIPGVGRPLRDAFELVGITSLHDVNGKDYRELLALHGVGKAGLNRVLAALREAGGDMTDAPTDEELTQTAPRVSITQGHTGTTASDVKTRPTAVQPEAFLEAVEHPVRRAQGLELLNLFTRVSGEEPVMWGPTIIGFGQVHYVSSSGREGDWFKIGFSPRKTNLTLYGMQGAPDFDALAAALGKHRLGAGCLYINKLEDVDVQVLKELVAAAWAAPLQGE